ncbi:MAG: hypothetical protein IAE77_05330 [Prosthecobacter sp.]|uniref:hypothetical protein n=1 Tax=Prosthecobacter sp. TaxID=1965333 RepID=UPI001A06BD3C|nr:hypothetical protein [Prosthecobacter sp.]MBE2282865.1 hypothetical protein [Prosthecobacter sp.]
MKTRLTTLLLTFLSLTTVNAHSGDLLNWTSNDQKTIQARFIGVGACSVLIEKEGRVFHVPFTRLSAQSVAQARQLGGQIAAEKTCPKPELRMPKAPQIMAAASPSSFVTRHSSFSGPRLPCSAEWNFLGACRDGMDIAVQRTMATVFGHDTSLGVIDPNDNGRCASGRGTWANPGILGCALPVSLARRSTMGSPFAQLAGLPWFTQVEVTYRGRTITVQLIDNGPSAPKSGDRIPAGIDLTPAACLALGIPLEDIRANRVSFPVSFRVKNVIRPMLAAN